MPMVRVLVSLGLNHLSLSKDEKLPFKDGLVVAASFTV